MEDIKRGSLNKEFLKWFLLSSCMVASLIIVAKSVNPVGTAANLIIVWVVLAWVDNRFRLSLARHEAKEVAKLTKSFKASKSLSSMIKAGQMDYSPASPLASPLTEKEKFEWTQITAQFGKSSGDLS